MSHAQSQTPKRPGAKPASNAGKAGKAGKANKSAPQGVAAAAPASRVDKVLAGLAPEQPALTHLQRETFAARYSNAACEEMGGRTRSEGVLGDAVGWAPGMAKALKQHATTLRRYSPARFAWFLECVRALAEARALQRTQGGAAVASKVQVEKAQVAAVAARDGLLETLGELTDGNEPEQEALTAVTGTADRPDHIVASLVALAKLARGWLERGDGASKELAASVGLTLAEVESAEEAAETLAAASADKTMEGRVVTRDTPPINRVEGRLLWEMKAAARIFARANARNKDVPKLVPGEATRSVLAPRSGKTAKDKGATAEAGAKTAPGGAGAGTGATGAAGGE